MAGFGFGWLAGGAETITNHSARLQNSNSKCNPTAVVLQYYQTKPNQHHVCCHRHLTAGQRR